MGDAGREPAAHWAKLQIEGRIVDLQFSRCQQRVDLHEHVIKTEGSCRSGEQIRQLDPRSQIQIHLRHHLADKMEVSTRRIRVRQVKCSIAKQVLEARIGGHRLQRLVKPVLQISHRYIERIAVAGVQHQIQSQFLDVRKIATRQRQWSKVQARAEAADMNLLNEVEQVAQGWQSRQLRQRWQRRWCGQVQRRKQLQADRLKG